MTRAKLPNYQAVTLPDGTKAVEVTIKLLVPETKILALEVGEGKDKVTRTKAVQTFRESLEQKVKTDL